MSIYYPDDIHGAALCQIEGCMGKGHCPRCGEVNYGLMGYYGARARCAKLWGVSEEEADARIVYSQMTRDLRRAERDGDTETADLLREALAEDFPEKQARP